MLDEDTGGHIWSVHKENGHKMMMVDTAMAVD